MSVIMLRGTSCCGLQEICSIGRYKEPKLVLFRVFKDILQCSNKGAFFFFTDRTESGRGTALAQYIKDNKLGEIVETKSELNPNSGNKITMWVWTRDQEALDDWFFKNASEEDKKIVNEFIELKEGDSWDNLPSI